MGERQDALVAASQLTLAVRDLAATRQGRQVGTVGRIEVEPNSPNVIPGRVTMSVEFRDLSEATLRELGEAVKARGAAIAKVDQHDHDLHAGEHESRRRSPTKGVQDAIGRSADAAGLKTMRLPSGAGHDAQQIARLCPMGMIFVPSVGRHQPLAERADVVGRLRERRERAAEDGARPRSTRQHLARSTMWQTTTTCCSASIGAPVTRSCAGPGAGWRCSGTRIAPVTARPRPSGKFNRRTRSWRIRFRERRTIAVKVRHRPRREAALLPSC